MSKRSLQVRVATSSCGTPTPPFVDISHRAEFPSVPPSLRQVEATEGAGECAIMAELESRPLTGDMAVPLLSVPSRCHPATTLAMLRRLLWLERAL